jgi:predicted TIM-barrel fold metal-dependent hydrolase
MIDTDPALAGLSDPRLARQSSQNRSQGRMLERVLIVQVDFGDLDLNEAVEEVRMLAESAGAEVAEVVTCRRNRATCQSSRSRPDHFQPCAFARAAA